MFFFFFFKQKTAYEIRPCDWSSDVCSSDLLGRAPGERSPPSVQLAQALTAALVGYVVGGFFLSLAYRDLLYTLLALIVALRKSVALAAASVTSSPFRTGPLT